MYVDLAERAAALSPKEQQLPYDPHWSTAMHAISGAALADALKPLLSPESVEDYSK